MMYSSRVSINKPVHQNVHKVRSLLVGWLQESKSLRRLEPVFKGDLDFRLLIQWEELTQMHRQTYDSQCSENV